MDKTHKQELKRHLSIGYSVHLCGYGHEICLSPVFKPTGVGMLYECYVDGMFHGKWISDSRHNSNQPVPPEPFPQTMFYPWKKTALYTKAEHEKAAKALGRRWAKQHMPTDVYVCHRQIVFSPSVAYQHFSRLDLRLFEPDFSDE